MANLARSEAAKGNRNAAKDRKENSGSTNSATTVRKGHEKGARQKAAASGTNLGAEDLVQHVADCVAWWRANVRGDGRPKKNDCSTAIVSVTEAEEVLGIRDHSISRWSKRLKDREKFAHNAFSGHYKRRSRQRLSA